jgi:hypothetical protein
MPKLGPSDNTILTRSSQLVDKAGALAYFFRTA